MTLPNWPHSWRKQLDILPSVGRSMHINNRAIHGGGCTSFGAPGPERRVEQKGDRGWLRNLPIHRARMQARLNP